MNIRQIGLGWKGWCFFVAGLTLLATRSAWSADPKPPADPMSRPTEYGIRFTPTMATAIAEKIVEHGFVDRYDLPEDRVGEATERVARRLMEAAHACDQDERGQELVEFAIGQFFHEVRPGRGTGGISVEMGIGLGEKIPPVLPAIRDLIRNVGQDLRPMLPMKKQLKLGGDLMAVKAALDLFEDNLAEWAAGNVRPNDNPFRDRQQDLELTEAGETRALHQAREMAERELEKQPWDDWAVYVAEAVEFYTFDEAQAAAAQSILREMTEKARALQGDEKRRVDLYATSLWTMMCKPLRLQRHNPVRTMIRRQRKELRDPMTALEWELKDRIDGIPTAVQRESAEAGVLAALIEQGFEPIDLSGSHDDEHREDTSQEDQP